MSMTVPPFEFVIVIALEMEKACEPKILTSAQQIEITILWTIPTVKIDTSLYFPVFERSRRLKYTITLAEKFALFGGSQKWLGDVGTSVSVRIFILQDSRVDYTESMSHYKLAS